MLLDFIVEFTALDKAKRWMIQADSSSAQKKGKEGVIIITPEGEMLKYGVQLTFPVTNNETEYEGILTGLRIGKALGAKNLLLQSESNWLWGR